MLHDMAIAVVPHIHARYTANNVITFATRPIFELYALDESALGKLLNPRLCVALG